MHTTATTTWSDAHSFSSASVFFVQFEAFHQRCPRWLVRIRYYHHPSHLPSSPSFLCLSPRTNSSPTNPTTPHHTLHHPIHTLNKPVTSNPITLLPSFSQFDGWGSWGWWRCGIWIAPFGMGTWDEQWYGEWGWGDWICGWSMVWDLFGPWMGK